MQGVFKGREDRRFSVFQIEHFLSEVVEQIGDFFISASWSGEFRILDPFHKLETT